VFKPLKRTRYISDTPYERLFILPHAFARRIELRLPQMILVYTRIERYSQ